MKTAVKRSDWLRGVLGFLFVAMIFQSPMALNAKDVDLSPKIGDTENEPAAKPMQISCDQVLQSLEKSYDKAPPDKMFAHRFADLLCRCRELTAEHQYTVFTQDTPQCLSELGKCYMITTPKVIKAIQDCQHAGKSAEQCKSLTLADVIDESTQANFSEKVDGIKHACK